MQDGQTRVQPYSENERKPRTHSERPGRGLGLREQSGRGLRVGGGHGRGTAAQGRNRRAAPECGSVLPTVPRFLLSGIRRRAAEKRRHVGIRHARMLRCSAPCRASGRREVSGPQPSGQPRAQRSPAVL